MSRRRSGFTLIELLVVIAVIAILVALLVPAVQRVRESASRTSCMNNVKQVSLAVQSYHDYRKKLPPAGRDSVKTYAKDRADYSWTYWILPYLEQKAIFDTVSATSPPIATYYCPTRREVRAYHASMVSDYAGNIGTDIIDDAPQAGRNGVFRRNDLARINLLAIEDGTSNTLMLAERRVNRAIMDVIPGPDVHDNEFYFNPGWDGDVLRAGLKAPEPDPTDPALPQTEWHWQYGGSHPGGIVAGFVDGSVRMIRFGVSAEVFRRACVRDDGLPVNHDDF